MRPIAMHAARSVICVYDYVLGTSVSPEKPDESIDMLFCGGSLVWVQEKIHILYGWAGQQVDKVVKADKAASYNTE